MCHGFAQMITVLKSNHMKSNGFKRVSLLLLFKNMI